MGTPWSQVARTQSSETMHGKVVYGRVPFHPCARMASEQYQKYFTEGLLRST